MVCVLVLENFYGWFVVAGTTSFPALSAALMCFKCLSNGLCLDCTMNLKMAEVLFFLMHFQQFCSQLCRLCRLINSVVLRQNATVCGYKTRRETGYTHLESVGEGS